MTYLTTFPDGVNGLVCDAQGIIWAGGYNLYAYNPFTDDMVTHGTFLPFFSVGGDFTFRNGNLYMIDGANFIRKVDIQDPANSPIVYDLSTSGLGSIFGLFSVYYSCDSIVTYTTGHDGTGPKIAEVNFETGALSLVDCNYPASAFVYFYGASTPLEYLGSIPCIQTLDLDEDNSSGSMGGDYKAPTPMCAHDSLPITDLDMQLLYYKNVDSVQVYLDASSLADTDKEQLIAVGVTGLSLLGNGTAQLTLVGQPSAPDSVFRKALFADGLF